MKTLVSVLCVAAIFTCPPAKADDLWRYPRQSPGVTGHTEINKESIANYSSRDISDDFDTVVKWYAEKINAKALTEALEKYANRDDGSPDISHGAATATDISSKSTFTTSITYFLTPHHKHVTFLHPTDTGDVIVVSIAGTPERTSVQIVEKKGKQ